MDILILGNGFDLSHNLKTKYSDFLYYCKNKYSINDFGAICNPNNDTNNFWLRHFIINELSNNNWFDFEEEIYNVIKIINYSLFTNRDNTNVKRLFPREYEFATEHINNDFDLSKIMTKSEKISGTAQPPISMQYSISPSRYLNYLTVKFYRYKDLISFLFDQLNEFTKIFRNYLLEEVTPEIGKIKYDFALSDKKNIRVLNFNYTNTFEELYAQKNTNTEYNPKYIYIHGNINDSTNNIILGTHSFYNNLPNDINERINVNFNIFKKHNQRHKYNTIEFYQDLLKELKYSKKINPVFHIMGHSLDKADHNILKHILLANPKAKINIYYHDEEALDRMQTNIDLIIGEENVMERVSFIYQHDSKRGILIPLETLQLSEIK